MKKALGQLSFVTLLLVCSFLLIQGKLQAQATILQPGDIAIIGYNYDDNTLPTGQSMSIVTLVPLNVGTQIRITDYGYDEATGTFGTNSVANTAEGSILWTITTQVPKGTVLKLSIRVNPSLAITGDLASYGSVSATGWTNTSATTAPAPGGGDNWFIFQGASPTSVSQFVFGWVNTFATTFNSVNQPAGQFIVSGSGLQPNNNNSYLPPSLTIGTSAIGLNRDPSSGGYHGDNNVYVGSQGGSKQIIQSAICNVSNWLKDELTVYDIAPGGSYFLTAFPVTACNAPITTTLYTETFENYSNGLTSFTNTAWNKTFTLTNKFHTTFFDNLGINNSDYMIDNSGAGNCLTAAGVIGSVKTTDGTDFYPNSFWVFPSQDCSVNGTSGTAIIRGKENGITKFTYTISNAQFNNQQSVNNGFTFIDLTQYACFNIDELEFEVTGSLRYLAIDDFKFNGTPPPAAGAIDFDGSNDYVVSANNVNITGNQPRTIEYWGTINGSYDHHVNWGSVGTNGAFGTYTISGNLMIYTHDFDFNTGFAADGAYHHIAVVYDGTSSWLYVDGNPTPNPVYTPAQPLNTVNGKLYVGIRQDVFASTASAGKFDDVRVWNRALCRSEIQAHMNCELTGSETGLVLNYKFNHGSVGVNNAGVISVTDNSPNNNTGTLTNAALTGSTSNWVAGNAGGACSVFSQPSIISTQPMAANIIAGNNTSFSVATSVGNPTYLWQVNTGSGFSNITNGGVYTTATTATLNITGATVAMNGYQYRCIVSGGCSETSNAVALTVTALPGTSLDFDGSNDYAITNNFTLSNTALTVEAWINPTTANAGHIRIIEQSYNSSFYFGTSSGTPQSLNLWLSGTDLLNSGSVLTLNQWQHVAFTFDPVTDEAKIYRNGVVVASGTYAGNVSQTAPIYIGQFYQGGSYFNGKMDEIRIWKRALTQAEIVNNMNCELNPAGQNSLEALYHFNHGNAGSNNAGITTLTDASGNGHHATLQNFALSGTTSNWVAPGGVVTGSACTVPPQEINVQGNNMNIVDGDVTPSTTDHTNFGSQSVCSGSIVRTFTIQNTGGTNLTISSLSITGTAAADYFVSVSPAASVAGNGSTTFQVTFNPSATGARNAIITVNNNDGDEATYDFAITGNGIDPEINILGNGIDITDGDVTPSTNDHTDFGSQAVCSGTVTRTFTIQNVGGSDLTTSSVVISGPHAFDYTLSASPSSTVSASGSTTFQIFFNPSASGVRNATITVNSNDCDEASYDFAIAGMGTDPEINLKGNGVNISSGSIATSTTNHTDFGMVTTGSSLTRTFTIENTGNSDLTISSISAGATGFSISGISLPATITASSQTTFTVTFLPTSAGSVTGPITISNNDCNESSYTFNVSGFGCLIPVVIADPANQTICDGANTSFLVSANNGSSYQWQVDQGSGFSNVSGVMYIGTTTNLLVINGATVSMNNYKYRCVVTSSCLATDTSLVGILTVNSNPAAPNVTPTSIAINSGQFVTFIGNPSATLKWYNGSTLLATGSSYTTPVLTTGKTYLVKETSVGCEGAGTTLTVTIKPATTFGGRKAN